MGRCSVHGCKGPLYSSGLCSKHYNRLRTTGTTDDGPQARAPLPDRFWKYVQKRRASECWPWTGKSMVKGYGIISLGGQFGPKELAHRVAWMLAYGPIPKVRGHHGAVIRHRCDNRLCCNPRHLEIGTQADNVRDMDARGGRVNAPKPGSQHPNSVLTEAQVRAIRASKAPSAVLAARYGIVSRHVNSIRRGDCWKHLK